MSIRTAPSRGLEAALIEVLAPLAAYAQSCGIRRGRFLALASQALRVRRRERRAASSVSYDVALRIAGRWISDPAYARKGKPRALPFAGRASFTTLVRAARAGSPKKALAALRDAGVVELERAGRITLRQAGYVPTQGTPEQVAVFGRAGGEFIKLLVHNLTSAPDKVFLQRAASYDNIGKNALMTLRKRLRQEGLQVLMRANSTLAGHDRDRNPRAPGGQRTRVSFGVYCFEEPVQARPRSKR